MLKKLVATCALVLVSTTTPTKAATITLELGLDELNAIVASTLGNVKLRINNLGKFRNGTFHQRNGSYARFPGSTVRAFDIPPAVISKKRRKRTSYFISDMRSDFVGINVTENTIKLTASFELEGPELVAKCVAGRGRRARECGTFPYADINLSQAVVTADLTPIVHQNSLSFRASKVELKGDVQISYCDFFLTGWLCNTLVDIPGIVERKRKSIQKTLVTKLNSSRVRNAIAKSVLKNVESRIATSGPLAGSRLSVRKIRLANNKLLITANVKLALSRR